jgi:hypothetical protein
MLELPGLLGYVQNRPHPDWWVHLPYLVCSETWFADRDAERAAYASAWYLEQIAVDEARMFARDDAWSSPVVGVETLRPGPTARFRVLAFGGNAELAQGPLFDGRLELLHLLHETPGGGDPVVVSAWTDEESLADHLARRLGGLTFVGEPAASVIPPSAPWAPVRGET